MPALSPDYANPPGEFRHHPSFPLPEDPDAFLWRYQDLPKLLSVFQRSALFFARADNLGDPFEGSYPFPHRALRPQAYLNVGMEPTEQRLQEWSEVVERRRKDMYVSCWHLNDDESAAMWDLHQRNGMVIAIRSSPRRMFEGIDYTAWAPPMFAGMVRYVDYRTDTIGEENAFDPVMTKRRSFAHEREFRAVVAIHEGAGLIEANADLSSAGVYVPFVLDTLIESIWVAPKAPEWFAATVSRLVRDIGLKHVTVNHSHLDEQPFF